MEISLKYVIYKKWYKNKMAQTTVWWLPKGKEGEVVKGKRGSNIGFQKI